MNIRIIALAALIFVVFYNLLFFHTKPGIGTGLLFLFLNIYFFAVKDQETKNIFWAVLASGAGSIFAFLLSFRSNGVVQLIDIIVAVFFSLVALYFYKFNGRLPLQLANFITLPFVTLVYSVGGFFKVFKAETWAVSPPKHKSTASLIRGLLITVPIFAILLLLLINADPIFNKLTQNLFSGMGERTIKSLVIFLALLGFGLTTITSTKDYFEKAEVSEGKSHELMIVTGAVLSLFAAFILVQFRYLFSSVGERELAQLGINSLTYSEYVRKGFFELIVAAAISCGLLFYVLRYFDNLRDKLRIVVHLFSIILTIETGFLLLSAAKRLSLYADAHGLTRARMFGFVFLVWLGILLVIFLIRLLKQTKKGWFFASVVVSTILVLVFVNIINIDGTIATVYKPTVNGEVDYYYLANLSTDAADSWSPAIEDATGVITQLEAATGSISTEQNRQLFYRQNTLDSLQLKMDYLVHKYGTTEEIAVWNSKNWVLNPSTVSPKRHWQAFNVGEYLAYKKIAADLEYYAQVFVLLKRLDAISSRVGQEVINNTPLDRSTEPPLIPVPVR